MLDVGLMPTKRRYFMIDWLNLHGLTSSDVQKYCSVITLSYQPDSINFSFNSPAKGLRFHFDKSLKYLVLPSLKALLGSTVTTNYDLSKIKIVQHKAGELELPFTEWNDKTNAPIVHLVWSGTADDLICLAHEIAHAAQMILSKQSFMPPLAREVCAFLGELALIRFSKNQSSDWYLGLQAVWHTENQRYFASDVTLLADDLNAAAPPYNYRYNYPLARVAAMSLFATSSSDQLADFFASGSSAMAKLNFSTMMSDLQLNDAVHFSRQISNEAKEDILAFRMSLSPQASNLVSQAQIDFAWLYRPASAGCINGDRVEKISYLPAQLWVKWRSLGVLALAALKRSNADILPGVFLQKYEPVAEQASDLSFSFTTPWVQPLKFDALTAVGMTIQQLAASPYHQQFNLAYYLPVEILPPLQAKQLRCFVDAAGNPVGLTTWAWLSDASKHDVHITGRALQSLEWSGGSNLFFNDWITDPKAFRPATANMAQDIFPTKTASSLRRNPDGSVRRINTWKGRKVQRL
ncbi:toxin-activating lysine-acyltransferase [Rhodobacteraceae bacterium Araon29]